MNMKFFYHSWRALGLYVLPILALMWLWRTDPDGGLSTLDMLRNFAIASLVVTGAHLARRFLFPYLKMEDLYRGIKAGNMAAAVTFCAIVALVIAFLVTFAPRAHAGELETFIPSGAMKYGPILKAEQGRLWPGHVAPHYLASLVEVESCVTLKSPRCWNPASRLKTEREEGAGFGQITRSYDKTGRVRMDALAEARTLDPSLHEWSWDNVYTRPDLQLRALVAMSRDCDRRLTPMVADPTERLRMCDAAYNGGYGSMQSERRACGQRTGCSPQKWFDNVAGVCLKSHDKWAGYGGRSACDINRDHVRNVTLTRAPKYLALWGRL